jgi:uncharacterized protein YqeY
MLARDEFTTTTLRGLKSAILYEEVAKGKRDEGLSDDEILTVITKQVKQRDDAIAIYLGASDNERADKETREREILSKYLPTPLTDDELGEIIKKVIADGNFTIRDMGRVIGAVKTEAGARADGGRIAAMVKESLQ